MHVTGNVFRFPRGKGMVVKLPGFGNGVLMLTRHNRWFGPGFVEVARPLEDGSVERYRLSDDGRMLEAVALRWSPPRRESLRWMEDLRFLYSRPAPGQPSLWTITWTESAPRFVRGKLQKGREESVLIAPRYVVKLAPGFRMQGALFTQVA